jgi:uncharacterized protein YbjT (DUF2867 family)
MIVVTGATGHIGSVLVRELAGREKELACDINCSAPAYKYRPV